MVSILMFLRPFELIELLRTSREMRWVPHCGFLWTEHIRGVWGKWNHLGLDPVEAKPALAKCLRGPSTHFSHLELLELAVPLPSALELPSLRDLHSLLRFDQSRARAMANPARIVQTLEADSKALVVSVDPRSRPACAGLRLAVIVSTPRDAKMCVSVRANRPFPTEPRPHDHKQGRRGTRKDAAPSRTNAARAGDTSVAATWTGFVNIMAELAGLWGCSDALTASFASCFGRSAPLSLRREPFAVPCHQRIVGGHWATGSGVCVGLRQVSYYEVMIVPTSPESRVGDGEGSTVGEAAECVVVGLSGSNFPLAGGVLPGWTKDSWAYHGDDGGLFHASGTMLHRYGPPFGGSGSSCRPELPGAAAGDVVGCGLDHRRGSVFFTLNGTCLGEAFTGINEEVFPTVGADASRVLLFNFGREDDPPFMFDVDTKGIF